MTLNVNDVDCAVPRFMDAVVIGDAYIAELYGQECVEQFRAVGSDPARFIKEYDVESPLYETARFLVWLGRPYTWYMSRGAGHRRRIVSAYNRLLFAANYTDLDTV